jgi:hypothetical protein
VRKIMNYRGILAGVVVAAAVGATACSASPGTGSSAPASSSPAATGSTSSGSGTSGGLSSQSSGVPETAPPASFKRVTLHETNRVGNFVSPTGNIMCLVFYRVSGSRDGVTCQTTKPPAAVTLNPDGTYKMCETNADSQTCVSGAPPGTPALAYGTDTGVGPFLCWSEATGVSCTANGKGIKISTSGVVPVG